MLSQSLVLLSLFLLLQSSQSAILQLPSPFLSCGRDPSQSGLCLVLSPTIYGQLSSLNVGDQIQFSSFSLSSGSSVFLALTRFSASETLEDLPYVVLLRGGIFTSAKAAAAAQDPFSMNLGATAFLGLSPHGSNGLIEIGNETYYLSTPYPSVEKAVPEIDQYVAELAASMKTAVGPAISAFSHNLASVLTEKSNLPSTGAANVPKTDYILPPPEVVAETDALISKAKSNGFSKERRTYRVATDVDYQMYQAKGYNYDATASYYYTLVGSTSSIYARDFGSDIVSSYLFIYTYQDAYPYNTGGALDHMLRTWNPSNPSRSFATLISAKSLGGGLAYVRVLCNTAYAYGVNGNMVGYFPVPIRDRDQQNWDIYVWAHETGHIWGASHTHDLNPPADYCGLSPGCGPTTGTIMSYCHLCSNGLGNILLSFHQYTKNEVLPFIGSVAC